jgi:hypothetical protein
MEDQLTFYLEVEDDPADFARRVAKEVSDLPDVAGADAEAEDLRRGPVEMLHEVTLTVTAAGGTVTATSLLVTQVQELLSKLKVRRAEVETSDGQVRQLVGAPHNEDPS